MKIQLFHQIGTMLLHGFDADTKFFGNLFILIPFCNQFQNLSLLGVRVSQAVWDFSLFLPSR
jgi:hypothetical protein